MGRIRFEPFPIRARCGGCGEVTSHKVLAIEDGGNAKRVRCQSCGHEWRWERKRRATETSEAERRAPKSRRETRECPWCGREFVPRGDAVWCSARCRERGMRHQRSGIAGLIAQNELLERRMREVGQ